MEIDDAAMESQDDDAVARTAHPYPTSLRLNTDHHSSSVFEDVEMAHDELYSGPIAESLPSSLSTFSHRRVRVDSTASFSYYEDEDLENDDCANSWHSSIYRPTSNDFADTGDPSAFAISLDDGENSADDDYLASDHDYALRRCSSTQSRNSIHTHPRRDSNATAASSRLNGRTSQKAYMENEDLTMAIAGFRTTNIASLIYISLCILSGGFVYLFFRWLPRLYIHLLGQTCPLRECDWVVVENQWGELAILPVKTQSYGRPLSSVFGLSEKSVSYGLDDDSDPVIDNLRTLDYRYVRFCFHPLEDKFTLMSGWRDPDWTDVQLVRAGLSNDEKAIREVVFGNNLIDIQQKSVGRTLIDEVIIYSHQG